MQVFSPAYVKDMQESQHLVPDAVKERFRQAEEMLGEEADGSEDSISNLTDEENGITAEEALAQRAIVEFVEGRKELETIRRRQESKATQRQHGNDPPSLPGVPAEDATQHIEAREQVELPPAAGLHLKSASCNNMPVSKGPQTVFVFQFPPSLTEASLRRESDNATDIALGSGGEL
mmetsp:Transcript_17451/g.34977  ORF Transcript_17451/g.34977 Transcript_17451/m.34977 type:complete len:177 (+) Transcript_17451:21-551(+)